MSDNRRTFVPKGWGYEDWIVNNDQYCGKKLFVKKGRKCSWHYHKIKDETFYVQSGSLRVSYVTPDILENIRKVNHGHLDLLQACLSRSLQERCTLEAGDHLHIPVGTLHQFEGFTDVELFEFSTHHDDEDSYRIIKGD